MALWAPRPHPVHRVGVRAQRRRREQVFEATSPRVHAYIVASLKHSKVRTQAGRPTRSFVCPSRLTSGGGGHRLRLLSAPQILQRPDQSRSSWPDADRNFALCPASRCIATVRDRARRRFPRRCLRNRLTVARIYLVRHGEATGYDGADPGLSELGASQAREVAQRLDEIVGAPIDLITSPLRRARETAQPLAARWSKEALVVARCASCRHRNAE